MDVLLDM